MTAPTATPPSPTRDACDAVSGVEIRLVDVTKRYPGQKAAAVDSINLTIPAGADRHARRTVGLRQDHHR